MEKVFFITLPLDHFVKSVNKDVRELGYFQGADGTEYCLIKFNDEVEEHVRITNFTNAEIAIAVIKKVVKD